LANSADKTSKSNIDKVPSSDSNKNAEINLINGKFETLNSSIRNLENELNTSNLNFLN
jgi:hypothetical protein